MSCRLVAMKGCFTYE